MWHTRSMAALASCWRLTESNVTVTPSVMRVDWLCYWYNYTSLLASSSTALAFLTNMIEKHPSPSLSAIRLIKKLMTVTIEGKLDVISWLGKVERIVDIWRDVRIAYSSVRIICDNAGRCTESDKSVCKVSVCVAGLSQSYQNEQYQKLWMWVSYNFIVLEIK